MNKLAFDISGMTCAACASRVEKVLSRVDGVDSATVNLALERATVESDRAIAPELLVRAVEKAGYGAAVREADEARRRQADEARDARRRAEERQILLRFAISA